MKMELRPLANRAREAEFGEQRENGEGLAG